MAGNKSIILIVFLILLGYSCILGQQRYITNIHKTSVNQGLSSRDVRYFFKGSRGFMWMGTNNGLNRYDGHEYKVYTRDSHGFKSNQVTHIAEDEEGILWILDASAYNVKSVLTLFDPIYEQVISLKDKIDPAIKFETGSLAQVVSHPKTGVWILNPQGRIYQYWQGQLKQVADLSFELPINKILPLDDGGLWLKTALTLTRISDQGQVIEQLVLPDEIVQLFDANEQGEPYYTTFGRKNYQHKFNHYEVGASNGVLYCGKKYITHIFNPFYKVRSVDLVTNQIRMIITQGDYLFAIGDTAGNITSLAEADTTFKAENLSYLNHELWASHASKEVTMIQTKETPFKKYLFNLETVYANTNFATRSMAILPNGKLCVHGLGFSYEVNLQTGAFERFELLNREVPTQLFRDGFSIIQGKEGDFWMTDEYFTLMHYKPKSNEANYYTYSEEELKKINKSKKFNIGQPVPSLQWALYEGNNNRIWIGHKSGLSYLDTAASHLQVYEKYNEFDEFKESTVYHFHENEQGIWLATNNGLYILDENKGITARYYRDAQEEQFRIPYNTIVHIYEDDEGYFWMATKGGGLVQWHPKRMETHQFTTKNGLSHNTIYAVYEDDYKHLWLSSDLGIMRFDKQSKEVNSYLVEDGITHEEFNTISHFKSPDGTIFFGGLNGVTAFHPKDFELKQQNSYPLQFTKLQKQSQTTGTFTDHTISLLKDQQIVLTPSDIGFVLSFSYLNFLPERTKYAYFIEGLDHDWTYTNQNSIRMSRLPYGDYTLKIKAQGALGKWEKTISVPLIQLKPYYLQSWFIGLCALSLALGVWAAFKLRLRKIEQSKQELELVVANRTATIAQQAEELKSLDRMKSKFFANISHELRTPLTLILGPLAQLLGKSHIQANKDDLQKIKGIQRQGKSLLRLVNEILDLSSIEAGKLTLEEQASNFYPFIKRLLSNYESQAKFMGIEYVLDYQARHELSLLIDRDKIEKVVNNLISNSLKFTPKGGCIEVVVRENLGNIYFIIKDTGTGVSAKDLPYIFDRFYQANDPHTPAQGGTGIGLAFAKELAVLMKGDITVKSELGKGSEFTFSFPLKQTDFAPIPDLIEDDRESFEVLPLVPHENGKSLARNTILLVEDHQEMQAYIVELLHDQYELMIANNGLEALALLERNQKLPDLIISDVMMPQLDGFTLLERIKSNTTWRGLPVVMLTARSAEADRLHALTIGVDDYLTKPFVPQELFARIDNLLDNYKAREEWKKAEIKEAKTEPSLAGKDHVWITMVEEEIRKVVTQPTFSLPDVAKKMKLSERQFQRNVKKITGLTPVKFQQEIQLKMARELLENKGADSVPVIAEKVGFKTAYYFTKLYEKRFGKHPNEHFV